MVSHSPKQESQNGRNVGLNFFVALIVTFPTPFLLSSTTLLDMGTKETQILPDLCRLVALKRTSEYSNPTLAKKLPRFKIKKTRFLLIDFMKAPSLSPVGHQVAADSTVLPALPQEPQG